MSDKEELEDNGADPRNEQPQETEGAEDDSKKAEEQTAEEWVVLKQTEKEGDTKTSTAKTNMDDNNGELRENANKAARPENKDDDFQLRRPEERTCELDDLYKRLVTLETDNNALREQIGALQSGLGPFMDRLCSAEDRLEREVIQNQNAEERIRQLEDMVKGTRWHVVHSEVEKEFVQTDLEISPSVGPPHQQEQLDAEELKNVRTWKEQEEIQHQNAEEIEGDLASNDLEQSPSAGTPHRQEQLRAEEIIILRQWIQDMPWESQHADRRESDNNRIEELEKDLERITKEKDHLHRLYAKNLQEVKRLENDNDRKNRDNGELNQTINMLKTENTKAQKTLKDATKKLGNTERILDDSRRAYNHMKAELDDKITSLEKQINTLTAERDDLKNRYSKLAGHKLTDQNPDIADLSDPNRAMKLSERFGALYDDAWTNAFEELSDNLNVKKQEAVEFLLRCLQECWMKSQDLASDWMAALNNAFIFPIQNSDRNQDFADVRPGEGLGSKELRAIRDARRLIGPHVADLVKQHCLSQICQDETEKLAACKPYLESCAEICWLMALADPPLYVDFTAKQGDDMDSARYTAYESSGTTIKYLVWPPLYASKGGGLLSKGTAATQRTIERQDHDNA